MIFGRFGARGGRGVLLEEVLRSLGGGLFGSLLLWSLCDEVGWLGWQRILFRMHEMYWGTGSVLMKHVSLMILKAR